MMNRKEVEKKLREVKALQGKSVSDILETEEFAEALKGYAQQQKQLRLTAMRSVGTGRLKAHVIDTFINSGLLDDVPALTKRFENVLNRTGIGSRREREYIEQLGMMAYKLAIKKIAVKEFPELKEVLFGTRKNS